MKHICIATILALTALTACQQKESAWDASGVFETTDVIVSAKSAGEIMQLNVAEGQLLQQGEKVGYIDTAALALEHRQLNATQATNESTRVDVSSQVAALEQQIANLRQERQRFWELYQENAGTRKAVDDIDHQIKVLQKQIAATREQVSVTNKSIAPRNAGVDAQRAQLKEKISNAMISSPITGTVLSKYAEPGEWAAPGRALFKVGDMQHIVLRAYVTADQLTGLKLGQQVHVYADQGKTDRKEYTGTIEWISDKAEFTPRTIQTRDERANLVYAIKIAVQNDGLIKRGMYGDVKF